MRCGLIFRDLSHSDKLTDAEQKFQPAKSRMTDIRTALQSSQQSNPNTTFSASWAESEEEPDTPKRQSLADRIQALSNAGVNTSKAPAYMHPQPHSAVLNGFSKHSLGTTQEEAPQEASPSAIPTPSRSHHSRPLPTTPNTVSRQPSPVSNIERPASQPLARSAADEAEKEFHSHFPSVDALEQEFPSMPTAPTHSLGKPKSNGTSTRNGLPDSLTPASNTGLSHSPSHVSFVDSIRGQSQPEASTSKSPLSDHAESKSNVPLGNGMLPNILHSYLQTTSSGILIIDVRSRPEFERAHFAPPNPRSVTICLEPITLRHALDATQLAASMFDSRPEEKEAFTKRAEFALIVVIDQSSSAMPSTPSMAASSEEYKYLFNLNQAIYVNEFRAPLPRPPVLLIGGMDAWEEAFGTKLLMGSAVDTSRGRSASSHLKRDSAYGDAPAKKANRKAKVTEGEMYGYNIARNVGDVVSLPCLC